MSESGDERIFRIRCSAVGVANHATTQAVIRVSKKSCFIEIRAILPFPLSPPITVYYTGGASAIRRDSCIPIVEGSAIGLVTSSTTKELAVAGFQALEPAGKVCGERHLEAEVFA